MKKLLLGIFAFLIGFVSFSSAEYTNCFMFGVDQFGEDEDCVPVWEGESVVLSGFVFLDMIDCGFMSVNSDCSTRDINHFGIQFFYVSSPTTYYVCNYGQRCAGQTSYANLCLNGSRCDSLIGGGGSGSSSSSSDITVYYNNGQTTSVACNGDNIITIDGLSTMSSVSTFTPYFNINYTDQNNQVLTDSYSNSILYLSGGQYLKTYTGGSNNDWILNLVTSSEDTVFTGYLPTFDVTGNITDIDTGNVFNNFAENSLTVLLSNIPNYIQYVIMFALLLFVLGIFRRLRK